MATGTPEGCQIFLVELSRRGPREECGLAARLHARQRKGTENDFITRNSQRNTRQRPLSGISRLAVINWRLARVKSSEFLT